jgi:hypothetical protein
LGWDNCAAVAALADGVDPKSGLESLVPIVNWERILLERVFK